MRSFTTSQTKEFLYRLKKHLYRLDYNDILRAVYEQAESLPVIISEYDKVPHFKEGPYYRDQSIVFKARKNEQRLKPNSSFPQPWTKIAEIGLVPENQLHKVGRGRINKPGQPIFYCSNDYQTACYEAISKGFPLQSSSKSEYLTVGCWKIEKPLNLARLYYPIEGLNFFKKYNTERYEEKLKFREEDRNDVIAQLERIEMPYGIEKSIMLLDFFSNEIGRISIKGDYDYKLCNVYSETVLERTTLVNGGNVDGILYPSVPMSYTAENVALSAIGSQKLKFLGAMYVWVTYQDETKQFNYTPIEQRVEANENGDFIWNLFK